MCGIAGIVNTSKSTFDLHSAILSMSEAIKHRGPDDEGFVLFNKDTFEVCVSDETQEEVKHSRLPFCSSVNINNSGANYNLALAHRRLSIIDISASGHQPMCKFDEQYWITFNGEIYNYIEIRESLLAKGHNFITSSDTEVILAAYKEWGKQCVNQFNGMWSFVIHDRTNNTLFASRDRFGVKPFYYYHQDGVFCFASEQKAIAQLPFYKKEINPKAVYDFFAKNEEEYETEGFFKNIIELFPSNNLFFDLTSGALTTESYYSLKVNIAFEEFNEQNYKQHIEKTKTLFKDAIRLRLRSDVAVGSCLSGGIDSSAITGTMNKLNSSKETIHLFTATFPNESIDESKWAKEIVDATNSAWHTCTPTSEGLFAELKDLVYSQDIPLWSTSTYAQFKVMELSRKHGVKVVLDGQGGDELFAGYLPYFANYWNELAANIGYKAAIAELKKRGELSETAKHWIKENAKKKNSGLLHQVRKLKSNPEAYLSKNLAGQFETKDKTKNFNTLNEALQAEFINSRLKLYLKCEDRCGMWHSVESRTPFADDIHLIENTFAIAGSYKMHNGITKSLLREAVKENIPANIYNRKDKMGYVTPNNKWLQSNKAKVLEILEGLNDDFIDKNKIIKNLDKLTEGSGEKTALFKALTYAVWKDVFQMK
jgi:asparagine synthase (glutamine-hydrolysing)